MPTSLPEREPQKHSRHSLIDILLHSTMVITAIAFAYVVFLRDDSGADRATTSAIAAASDVTGSIGGQ